MSESVAARIRRLRQARGLSQQELAVMIGAAVQSVPRWESERKPVLPTRLYLRELAAALGVSVEYVLTGEVREERGASEPVRGVERRRPVLQPLRDIVGRVQAVGEDALVDFVGRVVQVANTEGYLRRGRK